MIIIVNNNAVDLVFIAFLVGGTGRAEIVIEFEIRVLTRQENKCINRGVIIRFFFETLDYFNIAVKEEEKHTLHGFYWHFKTQNEQKIIYRFCFL